MSYIAASDPEAYTWFYRNYANYLKEWVYYETEKQEDVASLLKYYSNTQQKEINFDDYLTNTYWANALKKDKNNTTKDTDSNETSDNKDTSSDEKKLYYLIGKSIIELQQSPYLEQFKTNDTDVLLLWDPLDEYIIQKMPVYKWYTLISASSPDVHLGDKEAAEAQKKETEKLSKENKWFLELVMKKIGDTALEKAEFTQKIGDNLAVLVTPTWSPSPQMERTIKAMGQNVPEVKRILQINPNHSLIKGKLGDKKIDENILQYMYDQAFLLEWGELKDMAWFLKRVNELMK